MLESPGTLIDRDWLDTYWVQRGALHHQVADLHSELFILREILEFPFDLLGSGDNVFWILTANALSESAILGIWRLLVDNDPRCLSLRRFKNEMFTHVKDVDARRLLAERWKGLSITQRTSDMEKKVRRIRNEFYAHFGPQLSGTRDQQTILLPRISLEEMEGAARVLLDMLTCLGIGTEFSTLNLEYRAKQPVGAGGPKPDVIHLLECQAEQSMRFRAPEEDPDLWAVLRSEMEEGKLKEFNAWRVRLGRQEA